MTHPSRSRSSHNDSIRTAVRRILASGSLVLLLGSQAWCEPKAKAAAAQTADKAILTGIVSSVDQLYDDLKFVFQLAGDDKGYKTLKEKLLSDLKKTEH